MGYVPNGEQKVSEWSGGTTTELYLYPADGSYRERRFKVRLSTAVCRDETSVFTKLPDTTRILMVLDGAVELCHESGKTVRLCPGDQDTFSGGEKTVSHGVCQDFNLMLKEGADGHLEYLKLTAGEKKNLDVRADMFGIYLVTGRLDISYHGRYQEMGKADFLYEDFPDGKAVIQAIESSTLVIVRVNNSQPTDTK